MALPATHLRFAVDLANRFQIISMQKYLSGTLYPDSRWLTGVDRRSSHSKACGSPGFIVDDFTLGWHVHCRCDIIQTDLFLEHFPEIVKLDEEQRWIQLSILKMLQDREDMMAFDLEAALSQLTHVQSPNGENPESVKAYLDLVHNTYHGKKRLNMDDYHRLWIGVGLAPPIADRIMDDTRRMADDSKLVLKLQMICPKMVALFLNREKTKATKNNL